MGLCILKPYLIGVQTCCCLFSFFLISKGSQPRGESIHYSLLPSPCTLSCVHMLTQRHISPIPFHPNPYAHSGPWIRNVIWAASFPSELRLKEKIVHSRSSTQPQFWCSQSGSCFCIFLTMNSLFQRTAEAYSVQLNIHIIHSLCL